MARELRRLLISSQRLAGPDGSPVPLERDEQHYLTRVLRLRPGDRFAITDGVGRLWSASLQPEGALLEQPLQQPMQLEPPPVPLLELAVALPRRDADVMLRMVCELGIDRIAPLIAARSSVGERFRPERLEAILREASEQCERLWLPRLEMQQPAEVLFTRPPIGVGLLATTRGHGLPLLDAYLAGLAADQATLIPLPVITLAVGPEGGWTPEEEALAIGQGWQAVSLGPSILRVSTAAVAAVAALACWRLTCRSCWLPSP